MTENWIEQARRDHPVCDQPETHRLHTVELGEACARCGQTGDEASPVCAWCQRDIELSPSGAWSTDGEDARSSTVCDESPDRRHLPGTEDGEPVEDQAGHGSSATGCAGSLSQCVHNVPEGRPVCVNTWPSPLAQEPADDEPAGVCVYCGAGGALELVNGQGNRACANTVACELRTMGLVPADHLVTVARAVARDLAELSTTQLAAIATVLTPLASLATVMANQRPGGTEALEAARRDYAPRT